VASLPVVSCKQGAGVLGEDANGTPRGLRDSCYRRRKRAASRVANGTPPCAPPHPFPPQKGGQAVSAPLPSVGLIPEAAAPPTRLPPNPPSPARGDATAGSSVAPPSLCSSPLAAGTLDAGTVNLVTGGGCAECGAPAHTFRLSGERESAAQLALPRERGRGTTFVPDAAAAAQPHPETDAFRRLPFASSHEAPTAETQPAAFPDCQTFLDILLAENYDGDEDKWVFEAIANEILLRGERPKIHLKHKNGRVRVYTTQLSPRKAEVKTSQVNKGVLLRAGCMAWRPKG